MDNAPPPEPHDVRAHLHGGVPVVEIESLGRYWSNYSGLRERVFEPRSGDTTYADFTPAVTDRRALAELVKTDPGIVAAQATFQQALESWWQKNAVSIEQLAPQNGQKGNVYELRRALLADIAETFAGQSLLTDHQVRGAFARYVDDLKADLKSIAASGWGAELIPDAEILQSQFPEVLAEMEQKRLRLAELAALFAAADEEDYEDSDDTGVLPDDHSKKLKEELKELNAQVKIAFGELKSLAADLFTEIKTAGKLPKGAKKGDYSIKGTQSAPDFESGRLILELATQLSFDSDRTEAIRERMQLGNETTGQLEVREVRLARHKGLEDEAKQLKSDLRATEKKQEELGAAARAKIDRDEARRVILDRLHRLLIETYAGYLRADQRACLAALENLHAKYAVTAQAIESQRDAAAAKLKGFLKELGYE